MSFLLLFSFRGESANDIQREQSPLLVDMILTFFYVLCNYFVVQPMMPSSWLCTRQIT